MKKFSVLSAVALCIGMLMVSSCGFLPFGEHAKWRKFYEEEIPVIEGLVRETMRAALRGNDQYFKDKDKINQEHLRMIVLALRPMASVKLDENVYLENLDIRVCSVQDAGYERAWVYLYSPHSGQAFYRFEMDVCKGFNGNWQITDVNHRTLPTKEQN